MNGIIILLGESFRLGGQQNRNRGTVESYHAQMQACKSHIIFIERLIAKYNMESVSVYISSYTTQFDNDLLSNYNKYLIGNTLHSNVIGLNSLFHDSINKIKDIDKYDFILYVRIDLFLKEHFMETFNPTINMILFPTICWRALYKCGSNPRINDTLLFVPKKYYTYINKIVICHEAWHLLMNQTELTYNDLDTMIHTYHDSDSFKDYNPLYYIVNRPETKVFHSEGHVFDKHNFT